MVSFDFCLMKEVILSWSITKVTSRHATMPLLSGQLWCHCLGFFYRRTWIREAACKSKCWLLWFGPGESCIQKLQLLRCQQYYSMESMNQVCMLALVLSVSQWNTIHSSMTFFWAPGSVQCFSMRSRALLDDVQHLPFQLLERILLIQLLLEAKDMLRNS